MCPNPRVKGSKLTASSWEDIAEDIGDVIEDIVDCRVDCSSG